MKTYSIETLDLKHINEVTTLFNLVFKKNNPNVYFIKKYLHNDVLEEVFAQVAIYDNVVVSFCGLIPQKFGNDLVGHSCEYFTHPMHRGNGLLQKLFHQTLEKAKKHNMAFVSAFFTAASFGAVKQYHWHVANEFYYSVIKTQTLPLARFYSSEKIINWQWNKLSKLFKKANPAQLQQPEGSQKITNQLLAYKSYTRNALLHVGESIFWIKLDKVLTIGYMQYKSFESFKESLSLLKKECQKIGIDRIVLHLLSDTEPVRRATELELKLNKSFEVSIHMLSKSASLEAYSFDFYNFDTF